MSANSSILSNQHTIASICYYNYKNLAKKANLKNPVFGENITVNGDANINNANTNNINTTNLLVSNNASFNGANGSVVFDNPPIITHENFTNSKNVASKSYVDSLASGIKIKEPANVASTTNIDLSHIYQGQIDGYTLNDNDRVLLKNQTNSIENGVYNYSIANCNFTRVSDMTNTIDAAGFCFFVESGVTNRNTTFVVTGVVNQDLKIIVGSNNIIFTKLYSIVTTDLGSTLVNDNSVIDVNPNLSIDSLTANNVTTNTVNTKNIIIESGNNNYLQFPDGTTQTTAFNLNLGLPLAWWLDGSNEIYSYYPIICSQKKMNPASIADAVVLLPGVKIIVYSSKNYDTNTIINTFENTSKTQTQLFTLSTVNVANSCKVYYKNIEYQIAGISY